MFVGLVLVNGGSFGALFGYVAGSSFVVQAGAAAATLGAVQFAAGALTAPLVDVFGVNALAMAWVVAISFGFALFFLLTAVRPWSIVTDPSTQPAEAAH